MKRTKSIYLALLTVLLSPMAANADLFNFDVTYDGTVQTVDASSDPMNNANLNPGDSFVLDLHAAANDYWEVLSDYNSGIYAGLVVSDSGGRTSNYVANFYLDGALVGQDTRNGIVQNSAHIGGQQYLFLGGMQFDQIVLSLDFISSTSTFTQIVRDGVFWNFFAATDDISYNYQSVPEPGTLALLGLGLVGMAARRRKKV